MVALPPWLPRRALLLLAGAAALLAIVPLAFEVGAYWLNLMTLTLLTTAAALSWNWLGGYLGQVSFGHAALFGLGGFVAARLQLSWGVPMLASWLAGGVCAGLYGLLWGHPTLRLRGPYFSIATIGVGEATRLIATYFDGLTGGASGLSLPVRAGLKQELYWYGVGLAAIAVLASLALRRSSLGLQLLAIKSDVEAAGDVGVASVRLQDLVLFLSGLTMGACGGFYASYFSFIEPADMFGFDRSIGFVLIGVIGGIGTVLGPALGAVIFVLVRQFLIASYPQLYLGLYGLLLVAVILFEPLGLMGLLLRLRGRLGGPRPELRPITPQGTPPGTPPGVGGGGGR
jgi:branched-chain amino acid transport system permease protein